MRAAFVAIVAIAAGCGRAGPRAPAPLENEPAGFGGLAWGIEVGRLPAGMVEDRMSDFMRQTVGTRLFRKTAEDAALGGASLSRVQYGFYRDRFYLVAIESRGRENFAKLEHLLTERHGRGVEEKGADALGWRGERVDILLMRRGMLMYVYKPIDEEKLKDEREKRARLGVR